MAGFGFNTWIGVGEESTWGTRTAPAKFIRILSESLKLNNPTILKPSLGVTSQNRAVLGKKFTDGGFEAQFGYNGFETLLKHAIGSVSSAQQGGTTAYLHTYTLTNALPTGLTFHVNRDAAAVATANEYEGCQIEKITFTQEPEDILKVSIETQGEEETDIAVATPTFPTFVAADWEDFSLVISGSTTEDITSFELSIENTLAADRFKLGQRTRTGIGRGGVRKVTGKITAEFRDQVLYDLFQGKTTTTAGVNAQWVGPTADTGHNYTLGLNVTAALKIERNVSEAGVIPVTIEFEGQSTDAGNTELTATLKNTVTTA
jgi:hypothetical protein